MQQRSRTTTTHGTSSMSTVRSRGLRKSKPARTSRTIRTRTVRTTFEPNPRQKLTSMSTANVLQSSTPLSLKIRYLLIECREIFILRYASMKRRLTHIRNAWKNLMNSRLVTKSTSSRVWCCRTGPCRI